MNQCPELFRLVYQHPKLSEQDLGLIVAAHERLSFKKGEYFLKNGDQANAYYLIESGLLRVYAMDLNGQDITTGFQGKNEISIEVTSLFQRTPSKENIIALTDGIVWKISFEDFQRLFHSIAGLREWGREWMAQQLFALKERHIEMITQSATERYQKLTRDQPLVVQQAAIRHIASYLGITDTSLSRIRKYTF